jgi:L-alanine-DL-glutamate epimerase-like enolase superfamily enzyme
VRITSVRVSVVDRAFGAGRQTMGGPTTMRFDGDRSCLIACEVRTDSGIVGNGYGWSIGSRRGRLIAESVRIAAELLIGWDCRRTEAAWEMYLGFSNFLGHSGVAMMGMSVLDMAMWDANCKALNMPLWLLLGGHKDAAPVYSSHLSTALRGTGPLSATTAVPAAEGIIARGHTRLKVWVRDPAELDQFATVRAALPV